MNTNQCLLCGSSDAITIDGYNETDAPGISLNVLVKCPHCGDYIVSGASQRFYLCRDKNNQILNDEHTRKLSDYVRNEYAVQNKPVWLTSEVIKNVTGIEYPIRVNKA